MISSRKKKIGILIVAYNAATTISNVISRIPETVWEHIAEVFIFDDKSYDSTSHIAELERQQHPHKDKIKIFYNAVNLGYGGNQKRGYLYAIEQEMDVVVLLHGDGQYAPELIEEMIEPLIRGQADAVFGSRMLMPKSALTGGMPLYKYIGNRILTHFQNIILGANLSEYHSGYRAYTIETLK
ncbi:glycosyltransferase family 2 protein, partial [Desulfobulbus sp. US5]|nr:glycosyltransferase family 2 protein [Desulfobulbus sp. US5]